MNKDDQMVCYLCFVLGYITPWLLLAAGGVTAAFLPEQGHTTATFIVLSLINFMISAGLARKFRKMAH